MVADIARAKAKMGETLGTEDFDEVVDQVVIGLMASLGKWSEGGQRQHFDEARSPRYASLCLWVRKQIDAQILFAEKPVKTTTPIKTRSKEIVKKAAEQEVKRSNAQKAQNQGPGRPRARKEEPKIQHEVSEGQKELLKAQTPMQAVSIASVENKRSRKAYYKQKCQFTKHYQRVIGSITTLMANTERLLEHVDTYLIQTPGSDSDEGGAEEEESIEASSEADATQRCF